MKTDVFPMLEEVKRKGRFLGPIEHLRNDGTVFPTQTKITLLKNGKDEAVGFIVFVTDITERIQAEKSFTKQIFELTAANERLQSEISKQRQTIEQLEQFRDGLQQQVSIMPLEKPFTEYAESEEMMSENTEELYKLKGPGRPILNKNKLRSLSEMAKRLSK
jgi:predicted RNase H-like nuclease (RuvC/YqgF family)